MSEDQGAEYYLNLIFDKFEQQEVKLTKLSKSLTDQLEEMMDWIRTQGIKIFDQESLLYKKLDAFKKITPHTDHLVLYIDNWHRLLAQPEKLAELAINSAKERQGDTEAQKIAVDLSRGTEDAKGGYGGWRYLGERKKMDTALKIAQMRVQPQVTSSNRQVNFLDYAKDIPPELNKLYDWLPRACRRVSRWDDPATKTTTYSILRIYLEKLATMISGFSGAILELRKELVGERELAHAQAITAMKQAEYMSLGGMKMSDFYRMMREGAGGEHIGDK